MNENYYFRIKGKFTFNSKCESNVIQYVNDRIEGCYEYLTLLKIGKRADGWKPLFYKNTFYSSVKEIVDFYKANNGELEIVDGAGNEKTFEELEQELFMWNHNNEDAYSYSDIIDLETVKDSEGYDFVESK